MNEISPLTKDDISALKAADNISFLYKYSRGYEICATKTIGKSVLTTQIDCTGRIDDYRERPYGNQVSPKPFQTGYADVRGEDRCWKTIVDLLKPGDEIQLWWLGSNDSTYMQEIGFTYDEIYLVIIRGKKSYHFSIGHSCTPYNSSARLLRCY